MAWELEVIGPGFEAVRALDAAGVVLGRDLGCEVPLPDPQRHISRRHLRLWASAEGLHYQVLSSIAGVSVADQPVPAGSQGQLLPGEVIILAGYAMRVVAQSADAEAGHAGQEAFADRAPLGAGEWAATTVRGDVAALDIGQQDAARSEAQGQAAQALAAFLRGVGLDETSARPVDAVEWEALGLLVRSAFTGLLKAHAACVGVEPALHGQEHTQVAPRQFNPLKQTVPRQAKLNYLLGGSTAAVGLMPPAKALDEVVRELRVHAQASARAAHAVVDGTISELDPAALKLNLARQGVRFLTSGRLWQAYCRRFEQQGADREAWIQQLLERYFAQAYMREALRMKQQATRRSP